MTLINGFSFRFVIRVIHGIPQGAEGGDYDGCESCKTWKLVSFITSEQCGFQTRRAFLLISDEKGGYLLIPKVKNPYTKAKPLSFHQEEAWPDFDYEDIE
ncbi:hypothetical protein [Lacticaseibacillus rhamnosus]|uniref:hypothetical protein n=1 Tax=Lacticaseibacillus rhamnosus TaxID=47715 RepID=UPI001CDA806A